MRWRGREKSYKSLWKIIIQQGIEFRKEMGQSVSSGGSGAIFNYESIDYHKSQAKNDD